jgi:hypothetical protein
MAKMSRPEMLNYVKHSELPITHNMFVNASGIHRVNVKREIHKIKMMLGGEEIYIFMPSGPGKGRHDRNCSMTACLGYDFPRGFIIDQEVEAQEMNLARLICACLYARNKDILSAPKSESRTFISGFVQQLDKNAYPEIYGHIRDLNYGRSPEAHDEFSRALLKMYGL